MVVDGFVRECEMTLDILMPSEIGIMVGHFCVEIATLGELLSAKKYAATLGKAEEQNVDQSIIETICKREGSNSDLDKKEDEAVMEVLSQYNRMDPCSDVMLLQLARISMYLSNENVLQMIIKQWIKIQNVLLDIHKESPFMREILIYGVNNKLYHTVNSLFGDKWIEYMAFVPRPICLLDALKRRDNKMVDIVLNGLKRKKNYYFVCDDVFKECIKIDHIECAQTVVEESWHIPTERDYELAQRYYGAIHFWLLQRSSGSIHAMYNIRPANDENELLTYYNYDEFD